MTSDTARLYGLNDRGGPEAPGMKGDVNVIDLERLQLRARSSPTTSPPMAAASSRSRRASPATIVSGEVVMRDGEDTGARPGKLVRGEQEPAASVN